MLTASAARSLPTVFLVRPDCGHLGEHLSKGVPIATRRSAFQISQLLRRGQVLANRFRRLGLTPAEIQILEGG